MYQQMKIINEKRLAVRQVANILYAIKYNLEFKLEANFVRNKQKEGRHVQHPVLFELVSFTWFSQKKTSINLSLPFYLTTSTFGVSCADRSLSLIHIQMCIRDRVNTSLNKVSINFKLVTTSIDIGFLKCNCSSLKLLIFNQL